MGRFEPGVKDVHVDALLSDVSILYANDPKNYIAQIIFPVLGVRKQSNIIGKFDKETMFRDEAGLVAPMTMSPGSGFAVDTTNMYFCREWGYHKDVPDQVIDNAEEAWNLEVAITRHVTEKLMLRTEILWAADFFKTGVWGTDTTLSGTGQWSDYSGTSNPITDADTARDAIQLSTGVDPNDLVLGRAVWSKLKQHPKILDRLKTTSTKVVTLDVVAEILEVQRILVGNVVYASNVEGAAISMTRTFGKHALFMYNTRAPAQMMATAGYTIRWDKYGVGAFTIRNIRDDKLMGNTIDCRVHQDLKLLGSDLGYIYINAVA